MQNKLYIPLIVKETQGLERVQEPVTIGIPFPRGKLKNLSSLCVFNEDKKVIPFATRILNYWSDKSVKWALFDLQISSSAGKKSHLFIETLSNKSNNLTFKNIVRIEKKEQNIIVQTGKARFYINKSKFKPFSQVIIDGSPVLAENKSQILLTDKDGNLWSPYVEKCFIEFYNRLRAVLKCEGSFSYAGKNHTLRYFARLYFYAGHSFVRFDFTIWNPQAAKHLGGLWDLGDEGSIFFNDLSLELRLINDNASIYSQYCLEPNKEISKAKNICIYQDSSGGENWYSRNHVNRYGKIPLSFKGYRVYQSDQKVAEGLRATPIMAITDGKNTIVGTLKNFWQNFPKSIETQGNCLRIRLFPKYFNDLFELQGGEQKTHSIYLYFAREQIDLKSLAWVHNPLIVHASPEWYCSSKVFLYVIPKNTVSNKFPYKECEKLVDVAIKGKNSFFNRREIIDEYGWRNFGDLYADHENLCYEGPKPVISHYNNQYDVINSFLIQFIRTGEKDWFKLAEELAWHVIDIDIYHTDKDRYEYNRGLFWHTDHYVDAATSTHRSFSKKTKIIKNLKDYGGGPGYEHNYTTGLLNYYFLTGELRAKEAVMELVSNIVNGIKGPNTLLSFIKKMVKDIYHWIKNKYKSNISSYDILEGPGRASGNALNVLLDAYELTKNKKYLSKAEYLIRKCIHPKDNLFKRNLSEVNIRWPYTVFLQSLGKFLDIKTELGELDYMYCYAKKSLIHYAKWMLKYEFPYLSKPELLDYPNLASRAAQDIRKTNIFLFAAKYSNNPLKEQFLNKAKYFFNNSIKDLLSLKTSTWTRPLAILMQNYNMYLYFSQHPEEKAPETNCPYDFGLPPLISQLRW